MDGAGHKYGKIVAMAIGILAIGGVAPANADPITITSGNINYLIFDGASLGLNAANGQELGGEIGGANAYSPPYACFSTTGGCLGQIVNLSISDSVTSTSSPFAVEGGMIVDGIRYGINNFTYNITAGNVLTPLNGRVTTPFTFSATAIGTSSTGASRSVDWTGAGTATANYGATMGWASSDYTFSGQVSSTPEPASLLLFGTAISGVVFARRRGLLRLGEFGQRHDRPAAL